jgi:hypothetical protein
MSDLTTRRRFFAATAVPLLTGSSAEEAPVPEEGCSGDDASVNGLWQFRLDTDTPAAGWRQVRVPHTWQMEPEHFAYRGLARYRRSFDATEAWRDRSVRVEFEGVFHTLRPTGSSAHAAIWKP